MVLIGHGEVVEISVSQYAVREQRHSGLGLWIVCPVAAIRVLKGVDVGDRYHDTVIDVGLGPVSRCGFSLGLDAGHNRNQRKYADEERGNGRSHYLPR